DRLPFVPGMRRVSVHPLELILHNTWRPALAITGAAGRPLPADGGTALPPPPSLKLPLRIPPACDARRAVHRLKELRAAAPPYGGFPPLRGRVPPGRRGGGPAGAALEDRGGRRLATRARARDRGRDRAGARRFRPHRAGAHRTRRRRLDGPVAEAAQPEARVA